MLNFLLLWLVYRPLRKGLCQTSILWMYPLPRLPQGKNNHSLLHQFQFELLLTITARLFYLDFHESFLRAQLWEHESQRRHPVPDLCLHGFPEAGRVITCRLPQASHEPRSHQNACLPPIRIQCRPFERASSWTLDDYIWLHLHRWEDNWRRWEKPASSSWYNQVSWKASNG